MHIPTAKEKPLFQQAKAGGYGPVAICAAKNANGAGTKLKFVEKAACVTGHFLAMFEEIGQSYCPIPPVVSACGRPM